MANISIWNGSSTFSPGQTPFGFYDADPEFSGSADKVAKYCAIRLGYPLMDVELQSGSFYACFEEAITTYGNEVYQALAVQNYISLEGGSIDVSLNNAVISSNLQSVVRISENYGTEAGVGGNVTMHKGQLSLTASIQDYDLTQWAIDQGITGSIEIRKVYYEAPPAILRYFDPYAGTGTGVQSLMDSFGFGNMSPGINFMLMPAYFDVLKVQAIEFNDQIRKAGYTFQVNNNQLRIFPIPKMSGYLWFDYYEVNDKQTLDDSPGTAGGDGAAISNISNVPFNNPTYGEINSIGRQWVFKYTLALAKELLAYVRGKYTTVPVPGSEATLNQQDLLADARTEKLALIENLRDILEKTSKASQLERKAQEAGFIQDTLKQTPMVIFVG